MQPWQLVRTRVSPSVLDTASPVPASPSSGAASCMQPAMEAPTAAAAPASADTLTKLRRVKLVFDIEFPLLLRCLLCLSVYL